MVADFVDNVCEASDPFPIDFKCATKSVPVFQSDQLASSIPSSTLLATFGLTVFVRRDGALKPSTPTKRFLSASIELCAKKVLLVPFPQCVSLPSKRTRIYVLSGRNLALSSLGITRTVSGRRVINSLRSFARTHFAFSQAWLSLPQRWEKVRLLSLSSIFYFCP